MSLVASIGSSVVRLGWRSLQRPVACIGAGPLLACLPGGKRASIKFLVFVCAFGGVTWVCLAALMQYAYEPGPTHLPGFRCPLLAKSHSFALSYSRNDREGSS